MSLSFFFIWSCCLLVQYSTQINTVTQYTVILLKHQEASFTITYGNLNKLTL